MKKNISYDPDVDAISVEISPKKSDVTVELTEHILVDMTNDKKIVGIEILDASKELSRLFGRVLPKKEIQQLLYHFEPAPKNDYLIQFESPQKKERANLLIILYKSPILG